MCIAIIVSIVESQHKQSASIPPLRLAFAGRVELFQCRLKVEYTIVTAQVEEMSTQVTSGCLMVTEDNQPLSGSPRPPASQFHQSTIVKACCNQRLYPLIHGLVSPSSYVTLV